jgi:hypothetical protein
MVFTVLTHPFLLSNLGETYAPETQADVRLLYLIQCNLKRAGQSVNQSIMWLVDLIGRGGWGATRSLVGPF